MAAPEKNITYTAADLQRYHSGSMSEAEMHALEKAALEDPFLSDALDGYSFTGTAEDDIMGLKNIISEKGKQKKIFALFANKNTAWWSAAAVLFLIIGTVYLTRDNNNRGKQPMLAKSEEIKSKKNEILKADSARITANEKKPQTTANEINTRESPGKKREISLAPASSVSSSSEKAIAVTPSRSGIDKNLRRDAAEDETVLKDRTALEYENLKIQDSTDDIRSMDKAGMDVEKKRTLPINEANLGYRNKRKFLLTGKVIDQEGNSLPYVTINATKEKTAVTTDATGRFSIVVNDSIMPVTIAAVGYDHIQKNLIHNIEQTIVLSPSAKELNNVVVSAAGQVRQQKVSGSLETGLGGRVPGISVNSGADPVTGKENFNRYLKDSIRIPQDLDRQFFKGMVVLSFKITKNGEPQKIQVEKSLCEACDKEAIRLLLAGPKWKYVNNKRTTISINF